MSERDTDHALVLRAQAGDKRAFDLLVLKYQQKVANLIGRYIRDPSEVLDVTQEAFIKAYRALAGFRAESAFYTWLYRIAVNTVKNQLVAQGRRPPGDDLDTETAELMDAGGRLRDYATPERQLLTDEIAHSVQDALDALPKLTTIIALGQVAHQSAVKACGEKLPKRRFAHGAVHKLLDGRTLIDSYHTSRYNQNTGRITEDMFDEVFALALG